MKRVYSVKPLVLGMLLASSVAAYADVPPPGYDIAPNNNNSYNSPISHVDANNAATDVMALCYNLQGNAASSCGDSNATTAGYPGIVSLLFGNQTALNTITSMPTAIANTGLYGLVMPANASTTLTGGNLVDATNSLYTQVTALNTAAGTLPLPQGVSLQSLAAAVSGSSAPGTVPLGGNLVAATQNIALALTGSATSTTIPALKTNSGTGLIQAVNNIAPAYVVYVANDADAAANNHSLTLSQILGTTTTAAANLPHSNETLASLATSTTPVILKLEPGTYDLSAEPPLSIPANVTIQGAGSSTQATIIQLGAQTVSLSNNDILDNVTIKASGGTSYNAVSINGVTANIKNSSILVTGTGNALLVGGSETTQVNIDNSVISTTDGASNALIVSGHGIVNIQIGNNSVLANTGSVSSSASGYALNIAASVIANGPAVYLQNAKINGNVYVNSGVNTGGANTSGNGALVLLNSTVTLTGGTFDSETAGFNIDTSGGAYIDNSVVTATPAIITQSGSTYTIVAQIYDAGTLHINNSTVAPIYVNNPTATVANLFINNSRVIQTITDSSGMVNTNDTMNNSIFSCISGSGLPCAYNGSIENPGSGNTIVNDTDTSGY